MIKRVRAVVLVTGLLTLLTGLIGFGDTYLDLGAETGYALSTTNTQSIFPLFILNSQAVFKRVNPFLVLELRGSSFGLTGGMDIPADLNNVSGFTPSTYFLKLRFYSSGEQSLFSTFIGVGVTITSQQIFFLNIPIGIKMSGVGYGLPVGVYANADFVPITYYRNASTTEGRNSQLIMDSLIIIFNLGIQLELAL